MALPDANFPAECFEMIASVTDRLKIIIQLLQLNSEGVLLDNYRLYYKIQLFEYAVVINHSLLRFYVNKYYRGRR